MASSHKKGGTLFRCRLTQNFFNLRELNRLGLFLDQIGLNTRSFKRTWIWMFGFCQDNWTLVFLDIGSGLGFSKDCDLIYIGLERGSKLHF
jgi:hypothetical protein